MTEGLETVVSPRWKISASQMATEDYQREGKIWGLLLKVVGLHWLTLASPLSTWLLHTFFHLILTITEKHGLRNLTRLTPSGPLDKLVWLAWLSGNVPWILPG